MVGNGGKSLCNRWIVGCLTETVPKATWATSVLLIKLFNLYATVDQVANVVPATSVFYPLCHLFR